MRALKEGRISCHHDTHILSISEKVAVKSNISDILKFEK